MFLSISCFLYSADDEKENKETEGNGDPKLEMLNQIIAKKREKWSAIKTKQWMRQYGDPKFTTLISSGIQIPNGDHKQNGDNDGFQVIGDESPASPESPPDSPSEFTSLKTPSKDSFAIGKRMYYDEWEYYKYIENQKKLGISASSIVKGAVFKDLKTEMIEGGGMSMDQWILLETFCKMLIVSDKSSRLNCDILKADGHGVLYNYGLKQGAPVQLEHIIAVYIYCNFPDIRMAYLGELMVCCRCPFDEHSEIWKFGN